MNQPLAFGALIAGGLLIVAAVTDRSLADVAQGKVKSVGDGASDPTVQGFLGGLGLGGSSLSVNGGSGSGFVPAKGIDAILETIRTKESGGDYTVYNAGGGAAGAYQYIQSTWDTNARGAGYGQYAGRPASDAPPAVQDAVAAYNVRQILAQYGGNVADVPLAWYYPASIGNPSLLNSVPYPGAGNTETPAQYQASWLQTYRQISGGKAVVPR